MREGSSVMSWPCDPSRPTHGPSCHIHETGGVIPGPPLSLGCGGVGVGASTVNRWPDHVWPTVQADTLKQYRFCEPSKDLSAFIPCPTVSGADPHIWNEARQQLNPSASILQPCELDGCFLPSGPQSPHLSDGAIGEHHW